MVEPERTHGDQSSSCTAKSPPRSLYRRWRRRPPSQLRVDRDSFRPPTQSNTTPGLPCSPPPALPAVHGFSPQEIRIDRRSRDCTDRPCGTARLPHPASHVTTTPPP